MINKGYFYMKKIGYCGGALTFQLGNRPEMQLFFDFIEQYAVKEDDKKWSILTDRLYRKYLKLEELEDALVLMNEVDKTFKGIKAVDVELLKNLPIETKLKIDGATLSDVFASYFIGFKRVIEGGRSFYNDFGRYKSVKIIVTQIPENIKWKNLPDDEYEKVVGEPLWSKYG